MAKYLAITAALLLSATLANAQDSDTSNAYVGAQLGQVRLDLTGTPFDDTGELNGIYAGYWFKNFGAELAISRSNFNEQLNGLSFRLKNETNSVRLMVRAPTDSTVSFVAGFGYHDVDMTVTAPSIGASASDSDDYNSALVGFQVDIERVQIRWHYEDLDIDDADSSAVVFGLAVKF